MKTKKSLGQNFLRDPKILKKIVNFACISSEDTVVEVGPGEGGLTEILLDRASKIIAIEKDSNLVQGLRGKFKSQITNSKLEILEGDVLKLDIENLLKIAKLETENFVLVGNIPYYITGALFRKVFESENLPKSVTFVVQKEVADRILAKNKKESILSISIKAYGTPEYGGIIKAGSFYPKPKVNSAILSVRDISKAKFIENSRQKNLPSLSTDISLLGNSSARPVGLRKSRSGSFSTARTQEQKFFEILHKGFAHKRKLLIRNLAEVPRFNLDTLEEVFKKCDIPEKARAEDLSVENWFCLTKNFPL